MGSDREMRSFFVVTIHELGKSSEINSLASSPSQILNSESLYSFWRSRKSLRAFLADKPLIL